MSINELLNKDPDKVPEEAPLITFDSKYDVCMDKNDNYPKHTQPIARRVHVVSNGKIIKMQNIDWCEGCLKL